MGKKNKDSLGRALIKDRFSKNRHRKHVEDNTMVSNLIWCFYIVMHFITPFRPEYLYRHVNSVNKTWNRFMKTLQKKSLRYNLIGIHLQIELKSSILMFLVPLATHNRSEWWVWLGSFEPTISDCRIIPARIPFNSRVGPERVYGWET